MAALDDTHGAWVHEGLVGDRNHPEPPDHQVRREGTNLIVNFTMMQPDNPTITEQSSGGLREVAITTTVGIPNTIHFDIRALDSTDHHVTLIWQAVCPVRYNKTRTFWGSARNYDKDQPVYKKDFEQLQDTAPRAGSAYSGKPKALAATALLDQNRTSRASCRFAAY